MKKLAGIMKSGLEAIPLFLLDDLLKQEFDGRNLVNTLLNANEVSNAI